MQCRYGSLLGKEAWQNISYSTGGPWAGLCTDHVLPLPSYAMYEPSQSDWQLIPMSKDCHVLCCFLAKPCTGMLLVLRLRIVLVALSAAR